MNFPDTPTRGAEQRRHFYLQSSANEVWRGATSCPHVHRLLNFVVYPDIGMSTEADIAKYEKEAKEGSE